MFNNVSDIHIRDDIPGESLVFPGPRRVTEGEMTYVDSLLSRCKSCQKFDFMITFDGMFFRGRKEIRAVDGIWYHLRRMPSITPDLNSIPSSLPVMLNTMLMTEKLSSGGMIYIVGAPGSGKTTTASATVISRLKTYGGFAYTVEDPPEMPLNGWHGKGYCRQTWVAGDSKADWAESFRGILRSQPSGTPTILFVGEVRDSESAHALLRAASNGFLVIATGFGTDIPSGIESLVKLAGGNDSVLTMLAGVMRLVIHQRLVNGQVVASTLASPDAKNQVAAKLRAGAFAHLMSDIQFQANQSLLGINPLEVS